MSSMALDIPEHHSDAVGAKIAMWLFLFTELILFGGLFLLYAAYRSKFPEDFHFGATTLDTFIGAINTLVLLTSSLTMVLSIAALERKSRLLSSFFIAITFFLGFVFLINKYFEWSAKIHHGIYPNSPELLTHVPGENLFYALYYAMTGLHGLHVVIGMIILAWMFGMVIRKPRRTVSIPRSEFEKISVLNEADDEVWVSEADSSVDSAEVTLVFDDDDDIRHRQLIKLENSGLYWHLVDVIWIFLFPLFYLIS